MSKRKLSSQASSLKRPAVGKTVSEMLADCGFLLGEENYPNQLEVDESVFIKDFTKYISEESQRERFLQGLEKLIEDEARFKWCLLPTATAEHCKVARSVSQDSLFHSLLSIESLQVKISKLLLDKLVLLAYSDSNEVVESAEENSMAHMILSQFRRLNKVVDGSALAADLLEIIKATPTEVQRDIITLLPEITRESDHCSLAVSLSDMLIGNQELNASIVTTLSKLLIDSETFPQVRKVVLKTLSSANLEDLPEVLQFVLKNLKTVEMPEIIREIRNNLDFTSSFEPVICSTPVTSQHKVVNKSSGPDIMNSLQRCLLLQKPLFDAWIKVLDSVCLPQVYRSFDILVIFLMYSFNMQRNKIENLVIKKIKTGEVNENLISFTFRVHHLVLVEYVNPMLKLTQVLLKSYESVVSALAGSIYIKIFLFHDRCSQQEVVGNLVAHVTTGNATTANCALNTLLELAEHHSMKLVSFSVFIQSLLYHLDKMTLYQIRKVFQVLGFLCYQSGPEGTALEDSMHMNIRKQLISHNLRYHKVGIIGALMAAKTASLKPCNDESPQLSGRERSDGQIIAWLDLVQSTIEGAPEAEALFYDELSRMISDHQFSKVVEEYIDTHVLNTFQDAYIVDLPLPDQDSSEARPQFELEETTQPIALNLFGVMKNSAKKGLFEEALNGNLQVEEDAAPSSSRSKPRSVGSLLLKFYQTSVKSGSHLKPKEASALTLSSMFRLLRIRQQQLDGSLTAIDALLICSIMLPELQHSKFWMLTIAEKDLILNSLFFCINWVRELVNAFSSVEEQDTKLNVVLRLQLLVELQELACKYVQERNNYCPPRANFDLEDEDMPSLKLASKAPVKKASKKPKKSRKTKDGSPDLISTNLNESDGEHSHAFPSVSDSVMGALNPFLRELDIEVFHLLELGITFRKPCDLFNSEKERDCAVHPKELKLLLEDILRKLRHRQGSSRVYFKHVQQEIGFTNFDIHPTSEIVTLFLRLLPAFCAILEECGQYFRNIITERDEIVDSLILLSPDSQVIFSCMELTLKVMNYLLTWKGALKENSLFFKEALKAFASHERKNCSMGSLLGSAVEFLSKFNTTCMTLGCASSLVELMATVVSNSEQEMIRNRVSEVAEGFLKNNWQELSKKQAKVGEAGKSIQHILEAYLNHSSDVLHSLEYLATEGIQKFCEGISSDEKVFNTLNKVQLPSYYKIMLQVLVTHMKEHCSDETRSSFENLEQWNRAVSIFRILILVIKTYSSRSILRSALVHSRQFVDEFIKHAMPMLDRHFRSHVQEVLALLKTLQLSTRYMQHVCNHCKSIKDLMLTRQVPYLKRTLERFICRVKVMLAVNKCENAFWVGNLKNRDLKGNEILSQIPLESDDEAGEGEEDPPEEEDPVVSDEDKSTHGSDDEVSRSTCFDDAGNSDDDNDD